jgi:hypothetical protein
MSKHDLNVIDELSDSYDVSRANFDEEAYRIEVTAPAYSFVTIVAPMRGIGHFAAIRARDFFDEALARGILDFAKKHATKPVPTSAIQIIEGFHAARYTFDSVLAISPPGHEVFESESPKLHAKLLQLAPLHRCELSGHEDADMIKMITDDLLDILDWKRKMSPLVWMKYKNVRTQARSIGRKLGLAKAEVLFHELRQLPGNADSFIEVKNFKDEPLKLTSEGRTIALESPLLGLPVRVPAEAPLPLWMEKFLTQGFSSFTSMLPR